MWAGKGAYAEIRDTWDVLDVLDAHILLDFFEELEAEQHDRA